MTKFLVSNGLKVNEEKTQLLVIGKKPSPSVVHLETPSGIIYPSTSVNLLGCFIQESLKWNNHLADGNSSLKVALNRKLGALMRIRKLVGFKTRKMIAEGLFMSKLGYLISLWGGCTAGLKKDLQMIQNRVCRVVTRRDWSTPTQELLRQCGWLSVNQLAVYHSVLLVHKTKLSRKPSYLYKMHYEEKKTIHR